MKSLLLFSFLLMPLAALAVPVTVRVTDEAGAPVEGATVQVNRFDDINPPYFVGTTDAQGLAKYELGAAPTEGEYKGKFYGQVTAWKTGKVLSGGDLLGAKDGTLDLTLRAGAAQVSGTIEDTAGPVEGAKVEVTRFRVGGEMVMLGLDSPLAQKMGAKSDAKGQFTLSGVPAGAQLELRVGGQNYATQTLQTQSGGAVRVSLNPGATLSGKVVGTGGAPLENLLVYAQNQADQGAMIEAQTLTGADGAYRFDGLGAGTYNVMFRAAPGAEFVVAAREGVLAVEGEARELESARAVAGVVVRGRVIDAQTKAGIAGISVIVYGPAQPESSGDVGSVATDKDGNFSVRVVPGAARVALNYMPPQWQPNQQFDINVGADAPAQPLTFELTPRVPLRGRIVDENGDGVPADLVLRQENQEWPLQPDENGNFEVYTTMQGEVTLGRSMFANENDDEAAPPPWEVMRGGKFELPSTEPLEIVVRRAPVGALNGQVQDETGALVAGVNLNVSVANGEGIGSTSRWKTVVSDAQGRFSLPNILASQTVRLRGIEKTGYDLQGGGEITRDGANWKVQTVKLLARRNQLAGRVTLADGAPAKGALIFAAGSETRADENGAYVLPVLPAGNVDVLVYGAGQFGFVNAQTAPAQTAPAQTAPGNAATSTNLKLAPQPLQPTDRELASEILESARVLAAQGDANRAGRLKLGEADPTGSLEALLAAPPNGDRMSIEIYRRAGNPDVPLELLLRVVRAVDDPSWRLYSATMLFAKRPDWPDNDETRALAQALARDAQTIADDETANNNWISAIDLIGVAPLIERYQGAAAGQAALARAIAWVKTRDPQPGNGNTDGYLSTFAATAELVAANSPALFAQLLEAIDDKSSPAYPRAMEQGIEAIAKARGLEAAHPFLRQLSALPNRNDDGPGPTTNYAARRATRAAIAVGGASAPALALQLARELSADTNGYEDEDERARALAEAAFFQAPDVAAALWKQHLPQLSAAGAAQIAVRVAARQPVLGAELLELARQKLDAARQANPWDDGNGVVPAFAFYEARMDAAAARYRLEKVWWDAQGTSDDFRIRPDLVRAMSSIDGERAFEWASLLPADDPNDERLRALRDAALYIEASERARARVDFERWKRDSTVFMD